MLKKKLFVGLIALGIGSFAFASGDKFIPAPESFVPGVYVGFQGGYSLADWNSIVSDNSVWGVKNHSDFGLRGSLGFDIIKYLAIEAGYTQLFNKPELTNLTTNPIVTYQPSTWGTYAVDLAAKVKGPITDDFGLYGKAGGDYISIDKSLDGKSHDGFNALFGAGLYYNFTPNFSVDFSWTRYDAVPKFYNVDYIPTYDLFAAGIYYKFGF